MNSGIYQIRNLVNGKRYIGSTKDFAHRKSIHLACLRGQYHPNHYLQKAFNKYGEENFLFEILVECPEDRLLKLEQWFLDNFNWKNLYNLAFSAASPMKGKKHSEETRNKMSKKLMGNKHTLGRKLSQEHKEKIKQANFRRIYIKGRKMSEEQKIKIRQSMLDKNTGPRGPLTETQKAKIFKATLKYRVKSSCFKQNDKCYRIYYNRFRVEIWILGKKYRKTFATEQQAIEKVKNLKIIRNQLWEAELSLLS